ncbi:MAG: hypothetical protein K0R75_2383 [Paenibacillaceae bacterium]|nr:hypothetical protein [Paenibacillaceae bacterium]
MKKIVLWCSIFLVLLGIQSWFTFVTVHFPWINLMSVQGQWVVKSLDDYSGSEQLDVQVGDVVTSVNGRPPGEHESVMKWEVLEQAQSFVIVRDGLETAYDTTVVKDRNPVGLYPLLIEAISVFMALFLLVKINESRSSRLLSVVFLCCGLVFMSLGASIRGDTFGKLVINFAFMALPVVFLHFLLVFFRERSDMRLPVGYMSLLYVGVLCNALLRIASLIPGLGNDYWINYFSSRLSLVLFMIGFALNLYLLTYIYLKHRKNQSYLATTIKMVWICLAISFLPSIILSFLPHLIFQTEWVSSVFTGWFALFFPMSFAYLIATKQLYDVHMVLRRILHTLFLSTIPSLGIVAFVSVLYISEDSYKKLSYVFVVTLILISVLLYSLEYITTKLEGILFPRKYQLRTALKNISKNLGSITSFHELKDIVLVDIVNTLQVMGGVIAFKYRHSRELIHEGTIDQDEVGRLIDAAITQHPGYTIMEINSHEEYTSFLVMTRKRTGTRLGLEETQWLNMIVSYLSVSLENIFLIRKLTSKLEQLASQIPNEQVAREFIWFRKLMFELQEKERFRIATDIHDTTMQDLFFLKRRLVALRDKSKLLPEVVAQLVGIAEYVEVINTNLRQNCFELHPYLLQELGLLHTIRKLIDSESHSGGCETVLQVRGEEVIERWSLETKRHLFRIVQELLNNAKKHANAGKVLISLEVIGRTLRLTYQDDGVGFDSKRPQQREIGSPGVGMEQMRSRVLHLDGHLELATSPGCGVQIHITIPTKEVLSA